MRIIGLRMGCARGVGGAEGITGDSVMGHT